MCLSWTGQFFMSSRYLAARVLEAKTASSTLPPAVSTLACSARSCWVSASILAFIASMSDSVRPSVLVFVIASICGAMASCCAVSVASFARWEVTLASAAFLRAGYALRSAARPCWPALRIRRHCFLVFGGWPPPCPSAWAMPVRRERDRTTTAAPRAGREKVITSPLWGSADAHRGERKVGATTPSVRGYAAAMGQEVAPRVFSREDRQRY